MTRRNYHLGLRPLICATCRSPTLRSVEAASVLLTRHSGSRITDSNIYFASSTLQNARVASVLLTRYCGSRTTHSTVYSATSTLRSARVASSCFCPADALLWLPDNTQQYIFRNSTLRSDEVASVLLTRHCGSRTTDSTVYSATSTLRSARVAFVLLTRNYGSGAIGNLK
ncbi:hypothetical protein J6590_007084 [Homalodisca vitripennis]|nr:hypothetical protein J6590_007084 [Homalodisca vitripennis]